VTGFIKEAVVQNESNHQITAALHSMLLKWGHISSDGVVTAMDVAVLVRHCTRPNKKKGHSTVKQTTVG
jgi:hypothetical protein